MRTADTLHLETGRRLDPLASALDAARLVARDDFAWPGGYLLVLVMDGGAELCPDCVRENYRLIYRDTVDKCNSGWRSVGVDCLAYRDENADTCAHCGRELWGM